MNKRHRRRIENRARLARTVVHIMRHGFPLCGFSTEAPEHWPEGHRWLRDDQARHKITCEDCLKMAKAGGF
jgi:hypothetical protein